MFSAVTTPKMVVSVSGFQLVLEVHWASPRPVLSEANRTHNR